MTHPISSTASIPRIAKRQIFLRMVLAVSIVAVGLCMTPLSSDAMVPPDVTPADASIDTLVVVVPQLRESLAPWVRYRQRQGHAIALMPSKKRAGQTRAAIARASRRFPNLENLVLVGDAADWQLPLSSLLATNLVAAKVNVHFGSEHSIATDNPFGDFDRDGVADVAVGRIVASTPKELANYIQRVKQYEQSQPDADLAWRRRINLVAGLGGFGGVADSLIETTTRQIITDKIPGHYRTSMTHASWRSPWCPDPREFSDTAIKRFNDGCLFWIYLGHGERQRLDAMRVKGGRQFDILDCNRVADLNCQTGSPIAIFLSCYTGAMDSSRDCLAESMVRQPGGPIAVVSGSRVTMPYAMSLLSLNLAEEFFEGESPTLGKLLLTAKRKLALPDAAAISGAPMEVAVEDPYRALIESLGQSLSPLPDLLETERREHVHLINLLGDPLLRLPRPDALGVSVDREVAAGQTIPVQIESGSAGDLKVELVVRRDRFRKRPRRRRKFDGSDAALAGYTRQYEQVHDLVCASIALKVEAGTTAVTLRVPEDLAGECRVRAMVQGSGAEFALGSADVKVFKSVALLQAKRDRDVAAEGMRR